MQKLVCDITGNSVPPTGRARKIRLEIDVRRDGSLEGWETVAHNSWRRPAYDGYETLSLSKGTAYYTWPRSTFVGSGPVQLKSNLPRQYDLGPPRDETFYEQWCLTQ